MPIPKWKQNFYPSDWDWISAQVKREQGYKCKLCGRPRGSVVNIKTPEKNSLVVLTTHHLLGLLHPAAHRKEFLMALCQRCHLRLDAPRKKLNRWILTMIKEEPEEYFTAVETKFGITQIVKNDKLPPGLLLAVNDHYHIVGVLEVTVESDEQYSG